MATGGTSKGKPPIESGASKNDMITSTCSTGERRSRSSRLARRKPSRACGSSRMNIGPRAGTAHFVGEPKSPHGCDVTPDGRQIVVGGSSTPTRPSTVSRRSRAHRQKNSRGRTLSAARSSRSRTSSTARSRSASGRFTRSSDATATRTRRSSSRRRSRSGRYKDLKKPSRSSRSSTTSATSSAAEGDTESAPTASTWWR